MPWNGIALNTGTLSSAGFNDVKNHPGIVIINSSTSANSGYRLITDANAFLLDGVCISEAIFKMRNSLCNVRIGFYDENTLTTNNTDGAWITIDSLALYGKTSTSTTDQSTTSSSTTLELNKWYRSKIITNNDATQVDYYIYDSVGVQIWHDSLTTNIPNSGTDVFGNNIVAINKTATTAAQLIYVDYVAVQIRRKLIR
jgi:hypothetical protein